MHKQNEYNSLYVTRYMGAKYKLLDFLVPKIEALLEPGATLLDVMAGTHAVGYSLKTRNRVVSNDVQHYSEVFGKAIILNNSVLSLKSRYKQDFEDLNLEDFEDSWFVQTYGDTYFSLNQCIEITAIRSRIESINDVDAKNLYLTVLANAMSLCQSSSGHFAQYFPKNHPRLKSLREMSIRREFERKCAEIQLVPSNFENRVFRMEISNFLDSDEINSLAPPGSLLYLDPPYSSAQYSRYYHLLETVFLNDVPSINFKGLYRDDRHQSNFCSPRRAYSAFEDVVASSSNRGWNMVISYSDSGLVELEDLVELCRGYFSKVELNKKDFGHSTQGRGKISRVQEVAIVCDSRT